jgi:hypothetical protein
MASIRSAIEEISPDSEDRMYRITPVFPGAISGRSAVSPSRISASQPIACHELGRIQLPQPPHLDGLTAEDVKPELVLELEARGILETEEAHGSHCAKGDPDFTSSKRQTKSTQSSDFAISSGGT